MVVLIKIIVGLGLFLGIDILDVFGIIGDYWIFFMNKVVVIVKVLVVFLVFLFNVFVFGEEEMKLGYVDGYDFGFLYVKV